MSFQLIAETKEKIDRLVPRFPVKRSAVLPLLHMVQKDKGYISKEAMEWVAKKLDLQPINVYEVVTFYPMLREKPIGMEVARHLPRPRPAQQQIRPFPVQGDRLAPGLDRFRVVRVPIPFSRPLDERINITRLDRGRQDHRHDKHRLHPLRKRDLHVVGDAPQDCIRPVGLLKGRPG